MRSQYPSKYKLADNIIKYVSEIRVKRNNIIKLRRNVHRARMGESSGMREETARSIITQVSDDPANG